MRKLIEILKKKIGELPAGDKRYCLTEEKCSCGGQVVAYDFRGRSSLTSIRSCARPDCQLVRREETALAV